MKSPAQSSRGGNQNRSGLPAFTFVELLVVMAVLALGSLLLAPALARTQPDFRSARCLNNHRQLTRAWLMYASDNNDKLANNTSGTTIVVNQPIWAYGWMDWSASMVNTNTVLLADPRYSILATYFGKDARLFKCPADVYLSATQRALGWKERVRSTSQNIYVANGGGTSGGPTDPAYVVVTNLTGLLNPKPAETWVSMDEHPDSINDGVLFAPGSGTWYDAPASYHDGGNSVAFADGHAELHRWQSSLVSIPILVSSFASRSVPLSDPDYVWMRYHTPRRLGAN